MNKDRRKKVITSLLGQWEHPGEVTKVPSNKITMKGVNYPVLGIDDLGNEILMLPNQDYTFPGKEVTEYPIMRNGGGWLDKYQSGGENVLERDIISRILIDKNKDKEFIDRAKYPNHYPDKQEFIDFDTKASHLMEWGEDDRGQAYMYPSIFNDPFEAIRVPNQYADYISSEGYKKATGMLDNLRLGGSKINDVSDKITTDKNIATAINYLFKRNKDIYGDRGSKMYKPKGWLSKYQYGGIYSQPDINKIWESISRRNQEERNIKLQQEQEEAKRLAEQESINRITKKEIRTTPQYLTKEIKEKAIEETEEYLKEERLKKQVLNDYYAKEDTRKKDILEKVNNLYGYKDIPEVKKKEIIVNEELEKDIDGLLNSFNKFNKLDKSSLDVKDYPEKGNYIKQGDSIFDELNNIIKKGYKFVSENFNNIEASENNNNEEEPSMIEKIKLYSESDLPIEETAKVFALSKGMDFEEDEEAESTISDDNNNNIKIKKSFNNLGKGTYSTYEMDMSNGIFVTYQPRNAKKDKRDDVINNAVMVSDYLYDMDFTDGYKHEHARNDLNKIYKQYKGIRKDDRKFVQVREKINDNVYRVVVKNINDLTEDDFKNNNIYRQSWAKLSDLDIKDGKIKMVKPKNMFKNRGIPFIDEKDISHSLRIPGAAGDFNRYVDINKQDVFGTYRGATVTIVSDDGSKSLKVTGSLKDIIEAAIKLKKETGSKDVHFLQSDSGSMNVKADAINNKLTKDQLNIPRNQEDWAGASEILLNTRYSVNPNKKEGVSNKKQKENIYKELPNEYKSSSLNWLSKYE